jgi:hypothetical protein
MNKQIHMDNKTKVTNITHTYQKNNIHLEIKKQSWQCKNVLHSLLHFYTYIETHIHQNFHDEGHLDTHT